MSCPSVGTEGLVTYLDFTRAASDYLFRNTEPGLSISGDITIGAWVYFDAPSTGVETGIISKWTTAGNQRSYVLYKSATNVITFSISDNGTTVYTVTDLGANYATGRWFYIVGRLTVSGEMALYVNGMWYINTTSVPASIYASTSNLFIGSYNNTNILDGRMCHIFICDYSVPDVFICSMFSHAKAMFLRQEQYSYVCSTSSSSSSSTTSSSTTSSSTTSSSTTTSSSSVPP